MSVDSPPAKPDDDHVRSPGCCLMFWGPFRPLLRAHTVAEAATSVIFPTVLVAIWRATFAIFLGATFTYFMIKREADLLFYSSWCHLGLAIAFLFTSLVSFHHWLAPHTHPHRPSPLAFVVIAFFQVFATAALFLDVVYFALLFDFSEPLDFSQATQHVVNLGLVLFDMLLCLRMDFRLLYILFFVAYTAIYLLFAWIQFWVNGIFPYSFLDHRTRGPGVIAGTYFGILAWSIIAAVLMLLVSRLSRCFNKPSVTVEQEKEPDNDQSELLQSSDQV
eukprot:GFKZ01015150.1.p1 GENE.GFKZ01015150.1~~GFKZ01015150.1.p1  ORF type:complete len:276 (-),score=25.00 GFKZ01015150.1:370-1197(-)